MWLPPLNFVTLHYAYILSLGILGLIIIYPYGNIRAIDAYFFGVSASTESGLNTIDVKDLKTYQQLYIYFIPIISQLGFVNIVVVVVRLHWFRKRLQSIASQTTLRSGRESDCEAQTKEPQTESSLGNTVRNGSSTTRNSLDQAGKAQTDQDRATHDEKAIREVAGVEVNNQGPPTKITFALESNHPRNEHKTLYVPSPWERERGQSIVELDEILSDDNEGIVKITTNADVEPSGLRRRRSDGRSISKAKSIERVASSLFVVGGGSGREASPKLQSDASLSLRSDIPYLSSQATIGRNSQFNNLTSQDREQLGGIEYRSLKLLLKIVVGYYFGLHIFGAICLVGWIQYANPKYVDYLNECGQNKIWWGFYSAQTMVDNLGFTLTPDSMITFQDATFPLLVMSFLAYAGNTCYPCLLRLVIWIMSKLVPKNSSIKESLDFLLDHPRRCYTLLFPSRPTWILFGILFVLNFVDVLLIIVLDLHNSSVNNLPVGPRILAAIFQAANTRHTGAATFNLAAVHPAVQFSLLVMMYISVFPIAISIRASNTYEEKSLGIYLPEAEINESEGKSYVMMHLRNQLSFDLWYIFLGIFCICIAESDKIMDNADPAFAVFPIFFEVVSAYGNVGLSLGYPTVSTSLCGQFTTFSKLVICAMMIRGRHRGLPYRLDRAILLPNERLTEDPRDEPAGSIRRIEASVMSKLKRFRTT